jgi:hypothetical protein
MSAPPLPDSVSGLDPLLIFAGAGVYFNGVIFIDEQRDVDG